jgi:hypothetical protein
MAGIAVVHSIEGSRRVEREKLPSRFDRKLPKN